MLQHFAIKIHCRQNSVTIITDYYLRVVHFSIRFVFSQSFTGKCLNDECTFLIHINQFGFATFFCIRVQVMCHLTLCKCTYFSVVVFFDSNKSRNSFEKTEQMQYSLLILFATFCLLGSHVWSYDSVKWLCPTLFSPFRLL